MKSPLRPLRLLHVEDSPSHVEMVQAMLEIEGFDPTITRVETPSEFQRALAEAEFDLILSDCTMPSFHGLGALALARGQRPDLPFVFYSGSIGEEAAVESLKRGAMDFVPKTRPEKLVPAIRRVLQEIQDQKRRWEEAGTQQEQQQRWLEAVTRNALDVVMVLDAEGRFKFSSPSIEAVVGRSTEALAGRIAFTYVHPDDKSAVLQAFDRAIGHPEQRTMLEFRLGHLDGSWRTLTAVIQSFLTDPVVVGVMVNARDITEQRSVKQPVKPDQEPFWHGQSVEGIGALAGGIAHALNNVLTPIFAAADQLCERLADGNDRRTLEVVRASARRGSELVSEILAFAGGARGEMTVVGLKDLVREVTELLNEGFPCSIRIEASIATDLWLVRGNVTQLHQVLMNLCVNARDAMRDGGLLVVEAANVVLENRQTTMQAAPVSGRYVVLAVKDAGVGIAPELLDKIFEPFFTTKPPGKGTGLGLPTVIGIVKSHGGFVEVASQVGKGTTFQVFLPAAAAAAPRSQGRNSDDSDRTQVPEAAERPAPPDQPA